jgi:two-component system phosphate regulon sensor histidine kinase PhoR
MLHSRFFWKLYASYVALVCLTVAAVGWLVARRIESDTRVEIDRSLQAACTLVTEIARNPLATDPPADFEARIRDLGHRISARITVINSEGLVLADSDEDPGRMDNHLQRPEIQEALQKGEGRTERFSATLGARLSYLALPIRDAARMLGYVRVALSMAAIDQRLADVRDRVLIGAAFGTIAGLLVALFFARRVTEPLRAMSVLAGSLARGEQSRALAIEGKDELAELGQALNLMARELPLRVATIQSERTQVLAILGSMVEGVIAVDRDERVVHMNAVAGRILRVDPRECVGRRIWEVTRVVEVCEILDAARREAGERSAQVRLANGTAEALIELHASPLLDGSGAPAGAVVLLHDVTELRRLEAVRRDFVANVSHELKTPLTAIRGLVETVLDDPNMDAATQRRFQEKIRDQAGRLSALVSDLLTLARAEGAVAPAEVGILDLRGPLRDSAARFGPACEAKALILLVELPPQPALVRGDEESLRQIVDNLLDNALKYTPEGGRIWLRLVADDARLTIEVQDTGIGIEPRHQERIFERFYRVDKARSRELGGTGLGLSIVKHLTLSLGGNVSLESSPGRGSTFRVQLPRARE